MLGGEPWAPHLAASLGTHPHAGEERPTVTEELPDLVTSHLTAALPQVRPGSPAVPPKGIAKLPVSLLPAAKRAPESSLHWETMQNGVGSAGPESSQVRGRWWAAAASLRDRQDAQRPHRLGRSVISAAGG